MLPRLDWQCPARESTRAAWCARKVARERRARGLDRGCDGVVPTAPRAIAGSTVPTEYDATGDAMNMRGLGAFTMVVAVTAGLAGFAGPSVAAPSDAPMVRAGAQASQEPPRDVPITAIRSSSNCNVLTVTAIGIPGPEKVVMPMGWWYTSIQYRGTGGTDPGVWRARFNSKDVQRGQRLPVKAFTLRIGIWASDLSWSRSANVRSPACTAPHRGPGVVSRSQLSRNAGVPEAPPDSLAITVSRSPKNCDVVIVRIQGVTHLTKLRTSLSWDGNSRFDGVFYKGRGGSGPVWKHAYYGRTGKAPGFPKEAFGLGTTRRTARTIWKLRPARRRASTPTGWDLLRRLRRRMCPSP